MKRNFAAALLAALTASAAGLAAAPGSAEAGEVLNRLRSHGLGKWVDKYVEEDKSGKVRYKRASEDKWSGDYYDSKTGKWTGKKDGKLTERAPDSTSNTTVRSGKKTVSLKSGSTARSAQSATAAHPARKKYVKNNAASGSTAGSPLTADPINAEAKKVAPSTTGTQELPATKSKTGAPSTDTKPARVTELYGPPAPANLAPAVN